MPLRVVSLLPSATEVLCAVGGQDLLVGRSHECDAPPGVMPLPVLTAPRITARDPATIDAQVREALAQPLGPQSLYTLFADRLAALRPDIILTQDLCEVCSIDLATVRRVAEGLSPAPRIVSLNPHSVEDILDDHLRVARAIDREPEGRSAVVRLRERLFQASEFVNPFADGPVVAFLEWTDPLFCAGHWTVQLIERAGARHPFNPTVPKPTSGAAMGPQHAERLAGKSVRISAQALIDARPDAIVICPCGMDLDAAHACARELTLHNWWNSLPAVASHRVAVVDGNQMFNRPGPRVADAFEWLVGWLHGHDGLMPPGFPWRPLAPSGA